MITVIVKKGDWGVQETVKSAEGIKESVANIVRMHPSINTPETTVQILTEGQPTPKPITLAQALNADNPQNQDDTAVHEEDK